MKSKYTAQEKREFVDSFGYWHYEFDLGDGVITRTTRDNQMKWHNIRKELFMGVIDKLFNGTLEGKTFLDIACNSGFWSFELARLNASYGLGIDEEPACIKQAEFVKECIGEGAEYENIEFMNIDFFDLPVTERKYDLVLALGIVYHLSDPVGFFRRVYDLVNYCVLIDTAVSNINVDEPILEISNSQKYVCCAEDECSFIPNETALVRILQHTGFSNVMKICPPSGKGAFSKGNRIALVAFKD